MFGVARLNTLAKPEAVTVLSSFADSTISMADYGTNGMVSFTILIR
jgi:hypothetical protein